MIRRKGGFGTRIPFAYVDRSISRPPDLTASASSVNPNASCGQANILGPTSMTFTATDRICIGNRSNSSPDGGFPGVINWVLFFNLRVAEYFVVAPGYSRENLGDPRKNVGDAILSGTNWNAANSAGPGLTGGAHWPVSPGLYDSSDGFVILVSADLGSGAGKWSMFSIPYRQDATWDVPFAKLALENAATGSDRLALTWAISATAQGVVQSPSPTLAASDPPKVYGVLFVPGMRKRFLPPNCADTDANKVNTEVLFFAGSGGITDPWTFFYRNIFSPSVPVDFWPWLAADGGLV